VGSRPAALECNDTGKADPCLCRFGADFSAAGGEFPATGGAEFLIAERLATEEVPAGDRPGADS
jgi:hypothetical protein